MVVGFFRVRRWAVIGPSGSGKSSLIGALTSQAGRGRGGAPTSSFEAVAGCTFMHPDSRYRKLGGHRRSQLKKILRAARRRQSQGLIACHNVLLALRSDTVNGLPTAEAYLAYFIQIGWEIRSLVLLQPVEYDRYARFGAPLAYIENSDDMMTKAFERNWVYGYARNHFGWG